ncbi:MAG: hypothetical protein GOMPHAMPRED_005178 [Gomphillus americanus]|uniref:Mitochondrial inner membrane protease subunit n=1 Tax=Gomphillus americanus TaxID=1940652 RepID=A0A8H3FPV3_9LECA|nr:MAG: hypothetical protein GOMPHAMPRED_005178 [Gomphillus americanus]
MPFHLPKSWFANRPLARHFILASIGLASWIPVMIIIKNNVVKVASISGPSMYPYLNSNYNTSLQKDQVLLSMWKPWQNIQRGQLIAFWAPHDPEKVVVKRVIALEGDEITTRAPYPVAKEIIPSGYVWVEGDVQDRHKSLDSNTYGPISKSLIVGQLRAIVWPWSQMAWLDPRHYSGSLRVREAAHPVEKAKMFLE